MKIQIILLSLSLILLKGQLSFGQSGTAKEYPVPGKTILSGEILNSGSSKDTIVVELKSEFGHGTQVLFTDTSIYQVSLDHHFSITLPGITKPTYINLGIGSKMYAGKYSRLCFQYLIEPGDNIHVVYDVKTKAKYYTGRGAVKFTWLDQMIKNSGKLVDSLPHYLLDKDPVQCYQNMEYWITYQLKSLESIKSNLSLQAYNILKADQISLNRSTIYMLMRATTFGYGYDDKRLGEMTDSLYRTTYEYLAPDTIADIYLKQSATYSIYLMNRAMTEFEYRRFHHLPNKPSAYDLIKDSTGAWLVDKVIVSYLYKQSGQLLNDSLLNDAYNFVKEKAYRDKIAFLIKTVGTGNQVSGFSFQDRSGKLVNLNSFKGKVVLLDMWFTGCHGCVTVAQKMPKVEEAFKENPQVAFISLSIDRDKEKWLNSINPQKLVYGMYTHFSTANTTYLYTGGTGGNNDFIRRYNISNSYPCLLLIGKDGRIFSMNPTRPDEEDGVRKLVKEINVALSK